MRSGENVKNIVDHTNNNEIKAILKNLTSPNSLSDWSISARLKLSYSTYYRRKQEAYLLLGKMLAMVTDINLIAKCDTGVAFGNSNRY